MAVETSPLTRDDLREELRNELDRTLRHYATKADLAALETRITQAMAEQAAAHTPRLPISRPRWPRKPAGWPGSSWQRQRWPPAS